jgi:hypothetical protein
MKFCLPQKARHFFFIFFAVSSTFLLTKRLRLWPIYIAAHRQLIFFADYASRGFQRSPRLRWNPGLERATPSPAPLEHLLGSRGNTKQGDSFMKFFPSLVADAAITVL